MKLCIFKALMSVALGLLILTGCAVPKNLLENEYAKETIPNAWTYFNRLRAAEDDGKLKVSGVLRLKGGSAFNVPAYVEVALVDTEGEIFARQKVAYYPRVLTGRKRYRDARFTALFPEKPPAGTVIRLSNVN